MPSDEVIELSIDETNKLRADLGLAPLRIGNNSSNSQQINQSKYDDHQLRSHETTTATVAGDEVLLELSVEETNELRRKLGLKPLLVGEGEKKDEGRSQKNALHIPAENTGEIQNTAKRIERARLEREVQRGISQRFSAENLGKDDEANSSNALSWAAKMRTSAISSQANAGGGALERSKSKPTKNEKAKLLPAYSERELEGMNVSHEYSDLEAGATTVLTLADAPLLKTKNETSKVAIGLNDGPETLENVLLSENRMQRDGLKEKRKLELGMGRAGGYAGFDDDEFEELGGTQGSSQLPRGGLSTTHMSLSSAKSKNGRGFQIGANIEEEEKMSNDLLRALEGKPISLEPATADVTASDFMTTEEDEALKAERKKKDAKFKKKKKKDKHRKRIMNEEDDGPQSSKSLLQELEDTAVIKPNRGLKRRRAVSEVDVLVNKEETKSDRETAFVAVSESKNEQHGVRRSKYDEIMEKGNIRTELAFKPTESKSEQTALLDEEEPDDAFLNAALAKARRLQRLREMSAGKPVGETGVEAVVKAVKNAQQVDSASISNSKGSTITFVADDTREFTRALRMRAEQADRRRKDNQTAGAGGDQPAKATISEVETDKNDTLIQQSTDDITELAKEVREDIIVADPSGFDGTTGSTVAVGRGLSSVISMLQQTGEISGKRSGREELRGRAKDKRHYEDYEALDLSTVVQIDNRYATEKDKEIARREIKIEYRDKHGRLLTRKEAYRDLCYQFHGHGSSKKREDKRTRQIAMEQAEARLASRQVAIEKGAGTTLGALKATQEATGKAFVVHKT